MRLAILLSVPFVMGFGPMQAASVDTPQRLPHYMQGSSPFAPPAEGDDVEDSQKRTSCRDTIEHARAETGQPQLDEGDGQAPEPMLYKAVDHNVDGCDVLVLADGSGDIRRIPEDGPVAVHPAAGN